MQKGFLANDIILKDIFFPFCVIAYCLCLPLLVFSQNIEKGAQSSDNNLIDLGEIIVTSYPSPDTVSNVPNKATILDEEAIKGSMAQNVDGLLRTVSGIDIVRQSGFLSPDPKVSMRGLSSSKRTLVLIDGIPLNNTYSNEVYWNSIPIGFIERIEIMPGITSSLYGSGAMGGVINIITKKPEGKKIELNSNYGSFATRSFDLRYIDKIDRLSYSLYGSFFKSDGYIAVLPEKRKNYDIRRTKESKNFGIKLFYELDEDSEILGGYSHYIEDINGGRKYYFGNRDLHRLNFGFKKDLDRISLDTNLYFNWEDYSWTHDTSSHTSINYVSTIPQQDWGMNLQVNIPVNESNTLSIGTDYRRGKMNLKDEYYSSTRQVKCRGKQKTTALYFQDKINISEKLIIYFGGRFDWWNSFDAYFYDDNLTPSATNYPKRSDNEFSPKAGMVFHLKDSTTIRCSIGKAFRAPSLYELYRNATYIYPTYNSTYNSNPNLKPETLLSYELGLDQEIGKNILTRLNFYYNDVKDLIYSVDIGSSTKEKQNVAEAEVFGIEFETKYKLNKDWFSFINYTFNSSRIKKHTTPSLKNKYLTYTPKNKMNIGLTYDNPAFFRIDITGKYAGHVFHNDANTIKLKPHFTYDVKISKELNDNLEIAFKIENLTNKQYQEYRNYVVPPRFMSGNIKIKF